MITTCKGEERPKNWLPDETTAGMYEEDENWFFVMPIRKTLTVFPGDILQFLTGSQLLSTPHKVALNFRERFALAYFHEPNFHKRVVPLNAPSSDDFIHYGTHFTNMFMRCYPDRITTKRIMSEGRLERLNTADDEIVDKVSTIPLLLLVQQLKNLKSAHNMTDSCVDCIAHFRLGLTNSTHWLKTIEMVYTRIVRYNAEN